MPKRDDIQSVLVIGSGPIVIGQACEFDYSGTQACRVLREEGVRVILVNSNPATIMTDPDFADATYIEPITWQVIETIIAKERPDAILPTLGGQTALNAAIDLHKHGILEKYDIELIGANFEAINKGEDRQIFKQLVIDSGADVADSRICHTMDEVLAGAAELGYPLVVRPSFTMGGLGSGFAYNEEDLRRIAGAGLRDSPTTEVLLEESILGWKEYELELMRDSADNTVVVCSIENVDPVGVHTGDSITVAPALTLTDREYQKMRDIGIDIIRAVGVDTGGCNIQFAVDPQTGRIIVIEMNPRVSRSSALASKATGFPIAKIAAKLAIGYRLDEIPNDITKVTPASFEPTLDYVVVKVPRFNFEKFPAADTTLTTTMKSVGEAMAIGRNYATALQKALRSLEKRGSSFHWGDEERSVDELLEIAKTPTDGRIVVLQQAMRKGATVEQAFEATAIDPWFLDQIELINEVAAFVADAGELDEHVIRTAKDHGFSDAQIAQLRGITEEEVRGVRHGLGLRPVFKTVDTCAGEFPALTPYHYSSYDTETEVTPSDRTKVVIIGSGPNRIGQGVEFDYSCVHASFALADAGYETIMVNCNPETVSTDYDTSDRLYFEPLTLEDVLEVLHAESQSGTILGVICQLGGQTPLGLAKGIEAAGYSILGTQPAAIDLAEERELFSRLLDDAGLVAPRNGTAIDVDGAVEVAESIGYPVLVRPSFVLGGRGMEIVYDTESLRDYFVRVADQAIIGPGLPLLVDRFLDDAVELDVDALFDGEELYIGGVMEHLEEAGIHSGDSSCTLPPMSLGRTEIDRVREATLAIARGVGVRGLLNVQFAVSAGVLYVIEANPRASRTVPFVSKALGIPLAKAASRIMAGSSIAELKAEGLLPAEDGSRVPLDAPVAVKEAVLPFKRFRTADGRTVDSVLGPEMRSTGEVMGMDRDFPTAFAKSQAAAYGGMPTSGTVFLSVADDDKRAVILPAHRLQELGFRLIATEGTAEILARNGIRVEVVGKYSETQGSGERNVVDLINAGEIDMVVNTPSGGVARADGYEIRAAAVAGDRALFTTMAVLGAAVSALPVLREGFEVKSLQDYALERAGRR
ncbi:carbamoyl phosphate synthase large subunit [Microbacterium sp. AISO3]|jgi:carbamoyl-phosphate synthase large subunit|uniref:Carbamoyl phosphate synthase large chain n=2 Tax=Microbacterium TaxID=33882 RepID=A0ABU1HXV9_9MICO|nr:MULTISPECIES: carbamoyl-phosphate synthase large subunit [Microbacterium]MDR6166480.1 carbamoyl-phosphate synthase large subunit [Microbacterium paludicola]OAZ39542.1 carbamoyl phosphate synthase large subunit [Microbacterium arborescens]OWP22983.1 carbamoyl phosphate synthase large subunit [Microbacterium sp. AISO3]POX66891.1 carbamoyl-phosphate synthase large subunit [Microbacterium sp. Ru50]QCR40490.1 carbamoyl-phosphate synthase large subunit [Microbacterium sp. SGAir0570]